MDLLLNLLVPLLMILTLAGLIQPRLFVFWSPRKTRLQGFVGYLAALLVAMTLPTYSQNESWMLGLIMTGIVICAPLFIGSMIRPDDFVFWSSNRTRIKAAFVYLGGLVALISLQTLTGENATDSPFAWMFTPAVLSVVALAGAFFNPGEVWLGDKVPSRAKAIAVYLPIAIACVGGMYYLGEKTPPTLTVEVHDFKNDFTPGSPEAEKIARLSAMEEMHDFAGILREIRELNSIYEYQAALDWLRNRTFANMAEPRWALMYALVASDYRDADEKRALADTAAQLQVLGMTVLRVDAARCVDENAAMGKYRVWTTLSDELVADLNSRSHWERGNMSEAALNIEDTVSERPAAVWLCNDDLSNVLSDATWKKRRARTRTRIDDGLLFKDGS